MNSRTRRARRWGVGPAKGCSGEFLALRKTRVREIERKGIASKSQSATITLVCGQVRSRLSLEWPKITNTIGEVWGTTGRHRQQEAAKRALQGAFFPGQRYPVLPGPALSIVRRMHRPFSSVMGVRSPPLRGLIRLSQLFQRFSSSVECEWRCRPERTFESPLPLTKVPWAESRSTLGPELRRSSECTTSLPNRGRSANETSNSFSFGR